MIDVPSRLHGQSGNGLANGAPLLRQQELAGAVLCQLQPMNRTLAAQVDLAHRMVTIEHADTKNNEAQGDPLNDLVISVLKRQIGKHGEYVFVYKGKLSAQVNTKYWRAAPTRNLI